MGTITVTDPAAADRVLVGESVTIDATEVGTSGDVDIMLSLDNGVTFPITLASSTTLPYTWIPTAAQIAPQAVLRVRDSAATTDLGDQSIVVATTVALQATVRREVERMTGVRDWGVVGDAPLFEPAGSDNSFASWGTPVYDGTTRRLYYTSGNGSGSYVIRHIALDSSGVPTGSPTTVLTGDQSYDQAGVFLPVVEREGITLHMFYSGMPSLFTQNNICYATAPVASPTTWTKQGVAIAYSALPAFLHQGSEPTGLLKFGSTYYLFLCSTHGGSAAALGASIMDRRGAVATASSLSGPWTVHPLLCETQNESYQEPWLYNISPMAFRASSSSTALFYLLSASGGVNGDWQQIELHESPTPLFSREYTRHIGSVLVPRDEGSGFPDWEIDVLGVLTDDIEKDTYVCTGGEIWLYFGGKSLGEGWKLGLSKPGTITKALRPPIQTRCHRYGTQLPLRAANLWEREQNGSLQASTKIATVTSQTVFTLTSGPDNNSALAGSVAVLKNAAGTKTSRIPITGYVGSTLQVTLESAPAFTIAAGDWFIADASGSNQADNTEVLEAVANAQSDIDTLLGLHGSANPLPDGYVSGLTDPLVIGDDYTESTGRLIEIDLVDSAGDPAEVEFGDLTLEDAGISIQMLLKPSGTSTGTATVVGTCTFVPAPDVDSPASLLVSLPKTQTAAASPGKYDMQVEAKWSGGETVTFLPFGKVSFVKDIRRQS